MLNPFHRTDTGTRLSGGQLPVKLESHPYGDRRREDIRSRLGEKDTVQPNQCRQYQNNRNKTDSLSASAE